ncbi:MAG: hypothetical protein Q7S45_03415 [Candidatus Curtissbacteria bacterium]|nr:hypothetical protein [Candidatus Curtissbacteria bacterium]
MPEHDKERFLGGETVITSASDEAIEATLADLRREIAGLPDSEVVIEGESLEPTILVVSRPQRQASGGHIPIPMTDLARPDSSAFGVTIFNIRQKKKKAA